MDKIEDYKWFLKENEEIIDEFREHTTMTYDLFHPIILVLNHFIDHVMHLDGTEDKDVDKLFSEGFSFLYNALDNIKTIIRDNFDDDIEEAIKYDSNIYELLRIDELDTIYEGRNELISQILDQLFLTIENRELMNSITSEKIEEVIEKEYNDLEDLSTPDRFIEIADILGIDLL